MSAARLVVLGSLVGLLLGAPGRAEGEEPARPPYVGALGTYSCRTDGDKSAGHANGVVIMDKGQPIACFGLNKRPDDKGRYLYILLFKTGGGKLSAVGAGG